MCLKNLTDHKIHAVFSSQRSLTLEVVAQLSLIGPLTVGQLSSVGIECGERIGLILSEGWQMIDGTGGANDATGTLEGHILASLGLQQEAP